MRPQDRDPAYLWDMLDAARRAVSYAADLGLAPYLADSMVQAAVERTVEISGEASRRVSSELKTAHPEIPWVKIVAQRNVLAHEYGDIDQPRMWSLVVEDLPQLIKQLEHLIPDVPLEP